MGNLILFKLKNTLKFLLLLSYYSFSRRNLQFQSQVKTATSNICQECQGNLSFFLEESIYIWNCSWSGMIQICLCPCGCSLSWLSDTMNSWYSEQFDVCIDFPLCRWSTAAVYQIADFFPTLIIDINNFRHLGFDSTEEIEDTIWGD